MSATSPEKFTWPEWFLDLHPASPSVNRLAERGLIDAAKERYHEELIAASMGVTWIEYRRTYLRDRPAYNKQRGVVYFVSKHKRPKDGQPVKIGVARDLKRRLEIMQTGSPEELHILALLPGGIREERQIQSELEDDRIRGEWFRMSPRLRRMIEDAW